MRYSTEAVDATHIIIKWSELGRERSKTVWAQSLLKELHHLGLVSNLEVMRKGKEVDKTLKVLEIKKLKPGINEWYSKATLIEKMNHRNFGELPQWAQ